MDIRDLVGRNVGRLRRERGLTQEELEERSGLTQQYLSSLENGRRNPTVLTLVRLAEALGCTPVELISPDAVGRGEARRVAAPKPSRRKPAARGGA